MTRLLRRERSFAATSRRHLLVFRVQLRLRSHFVGLPFGFHVFNRLLLYRFGVLMRKRRHQKGLAVFSLVLAKQCASRRPL